jgi:predicted Abi (CAAX) family protease
MIERLSQAFLAVPTASGWLWTVLLFVCFAASSLVVLRLSGLFRFSPSRLPLRYNLLLFLIAFFTPSLPEEALYRALLLPPLDEARALFWIALSLFLYVIAHPLLAFLIMHSYRPIFYKPAFLLIVALLGISCTLAFYLTGSIWPPILIHWATIVLWKAFYSGPDFGLGKAP